MDEGSCIMNRDLVMEDIKNPFMIDNFVKYAQNLTSTLNSTDWGKVTLLGEALLDCWKKGKKVFLCGNGGSAANAMHIANDFLYGVSKKFGNGLKTQALSDNISIMTCLANDEGYEHIFAYQLAVQASKEDILIVFSSSGNSPNLLNVLKVAREMGVQTFAILGFSGGKARDLADVALTYNINDVQISEDLQLIICHMLIQQLYKINKQTLFKEEA